MPGFMQKGLMLYASPLKHVLRGFYFEGSGFDSAAFYVWAFFLPLYVPSTHVSFNFGKRLGEGSGKRWNLNAPSLHDELWASIQRDGLPFLEGVKEPCDLPEAILQLGTNFDPYRMEAVAYSLAMADDVASAKQALERLRNGLDMGISWQAEIGERAEQLAVKLADSSHKAKIQLAEWEKITVNNLGLN